MINRIPGLIPGQAAHRKIRIHSPLLLQREGRFLIQTCLRKNALDGRQTQRGVENSTPARPSPFWEAVNTSARALLTVSFQLFTVLNYNYNTITKHAQLHPKPYHLLPQYHHPPSPKPTHIASPTANALPYSIPTYFRVKINVFV